MLESIDFKSARLILEYGPGTGVFTREILKRGRADLKLIAFELNPTFFDYLQKEIKDPRLVCVNDGAEKSLEYLRGQGLDGVDHIVSSLPFSHIPENIKTIVLKDAGKLLKDKGTFNHYRYNGKFVPELSRYFPKVEMKSVLLNIPPAYVYRGQQTL